MTELTTSGELQIDYQAGPSGTNRYWVTVSCPQACDRSTQHRDELAERGGGEILFTGGVKSSSPQGVKRASPEPSVEPSLNQTKKGTRLSEDWQPSTGLTEWAAENWPWLDVVGQTEAFIDYWVSKPTNATKLDWDRTWKNWMRRSAQDTKPRGARKTAAEDNWSIVQKYQRGAFSG